MPMMLKNWDSQAPICQVCCCLCSQIYNPFTGVCPRLWSGKPWRMLSSPQLTQACNWQLWEVAADCQIDAHVMTRGILGILRLAFTSFCHHLLLIHWGRIIKEVACSGSCDLTIGFHVNAQLKLNCLYTLILVVGEVAEFGKCLVKSEVWIMLSKVKWLKIDYFWCAWTHARLQVLGWKT